MSSETGRSVTADRNDRSAANIGRCSAIWPGTRIATSGTRHRSRLPDGVLKRPASVSSSIPSERAKAASTTLLVTRLSSMAHTSRPSTSARNSAVPRTRS
jgi:hypothetical protein